jgi:hypothetical protein
MGLTSIHGKWDGCWSLCLFLFALDKITLRMFCELSFVVVATKGMIGFSSSTTMFAVIKRLQRQGISL